MHLRNELSFVLSRISSAILKIIGVTCREIADHILGAEQKVNEVPATRPTVFKTRGKRESQKVATGTDVEVEAPTIKPRRSSHEYEARDHNQFKLAAIDILRHYLNESPESRETVRQLHSLMDTNSPSMVRKACNILVEDEVMASHLAEGGKATVYWIKDVDAARAYLTKLEEVAPTLPDSE